MIGPHTKAPSENDLNVHMPPSQHTTVHEQTLIRTYTNAETTIIKRILECNLFSLSRFLGLS
ncbi:hypothetical protein FF38_01093 [Lucilia cuprina]|uniref:Uncharacterized protein n=1 Tax=Lucilia cuprina TaxID=7375 RepID=A0A0L0C525_LUCCU|nr:hypothetical protein FF38_01093 [Lucilia cuprina]